MKKFGVDENTNDNGIVSLNAGIIENLFVSAVTVSTEDAENPYLEITLSDSSNATVSRRFYEPKIGPYIKNEKELDKSIQKLNNLVGNFLRTLISDNYMLKDANSFVDFITKVANACQAPIKNKIPIRAVIVLNSQDFTTLRGYAPCIERMSIPKEASKLRLTKFDKVVADNIKPDNDSNNDTPSTETATNAWTEVENGDTNTSNEDGDGLPF